MLAIKIMMAIGYEPDCHITTIPENIVAGISLPRLMVFIIGSKFAGIKSMDAVSIHAIALFAELGFLKCVIE